jgi:citrate synthase
MKPEYRDSMVKLAMLLNDKLESMCKRIGEQLLETNVRLVYSNALSVMMMDNTTFIKSVDAWSASLFWHSRLANRAFPIVFDQARLLGWATE